MRTSRHFSSVRRSVHSYFKLFCLSLGFTAPINGAYEFVVTRGLHGTGITGFTFLLTQEALLSPTGLSTLTLLLNSFVTARSVKLTS